MAVTELLKIAEGEWIRAPGKKHGSNRSLENKIKPEKSHSIDNSCRKSLMVKKINQVFEIFQYDLFIPVVFHSGLGNGSGGLTENRYWRIEQSTRLKKPGSKRFKKSKTHYIANICRKVSQPSY